MPAVEQGQPTGVGANSYTKYEQDHSYTYDNGVVVMVVASRTPKHRLIRLHGGIGTRRVNWETQRRGKPPQVPTMDDLGYDSFLSGTITAMLPVPDPQGIGYFWRVTGTYDYVQTNPRVVGTDTIPTGTYPFPIAPNDPIGASMAQPFMAAFNAADPLTTNPWNDLAVSLGETLVDHDSDNYLWPYTVLPPIFSNPNLLGN